MVRENGYVNWDDTLKKMGIDTTSLDTVMESDKVTVAEDGSSNVFSFKYNDDNLFFKTNSIRGEYNHYAELLALELAKDFGIPCAQYDLAKICGHKGVTSKDIRKENATYINLKDIIRKYHDNDLMDNFDLLTIWKDLNKYYENRPDREKIVANLVSQIVDIFIFDVLVAQYDPYNLKIMEYDGKVSMAPIYDNEFMQAKFRGTDFRFGVDEKLYSTDEDEKNDSEDEDKDRALIAFDRFLSISSTEFVKRVVDKMWVIGEDNLDKKFGIIERKTGDYPVPEDIKNKFIAKFTNHRKNLIEVLNKHIDVPIVESKKR